jgi:hypothetical protein
LLQAFVPLRTALQIGADEGFELAKATLCRQGHKLYSEVWNDQPPLHTFLVTQALRHISASVLVPRLITVGFSALLLGSVFALVRRVNGAVVGGLTALLLLAAPGFLELSSSCMLEIPSLSMAVAGLAVLCVGWPRRSLVRVALAGALFGAALLMKHVPLLLAPVGMLLLWMLPSDEGKEKSAPRDLWRLTVSLAVFGLFAAGCFVLCDLFIERGAYLAHFRQSWTSHFGETKSTELGSPGDYPFQWTLFLRNWDLSLPALVGITALVREEWRAKATWVPLLWLGVNLVVFSVHRPWWTYYYVHLATPLAWCAAVGLKEIWSRVVQLWSVAKHADKSGVGGSSRDRRRLAVAGFTAGCVAFSVAAATWMGARVYLQILGMRDSPRIHATPVLTELKRHAANTRYLFTDATVLSFHSGIPLPPSLAVLPLKRFWSGEITSAGVAAELEHEQPGVIVLPVTSEEVPYSEWLRRKYRLVYQDNRYLVYRARSIAIGPPACVEAGATPWSGTGQLQEGNDVLLQLSQSQSHERLKGHGVGHIELARHGPPQGSEMGPASDFLPEVMGDGSHIGAFGASEAEETDRFLVVRKAKGINVDQPGLPFDLNALASQLVQRHASLLDGRNHRRGLHLVPNKLRGGGIEFLQGHRRNRERGDQFSVRVVAVGALAQLHRSFVDFVIAHQPLGKLRALTQDDNQEARSGRIEGPTMTDFLDSELPPEGVDYVVRGGASRFIHQQRPVQS